jgi:hypothetical protein
LIYIDETPVISYETIPFNQGKTIVISRHHSSRIGVLGAKASNLAIAIEGVIKYIVGVGIYKPLFRTGFGNPTVLFNDKIDVVMLRSTYSNFVVPPCLLFAYTLTNLQDIFAVTRLRFDVNKLLQFHAWTADNLNSFCNLKELHLVGSYVDQPKVGQKFHLVMSFQSYWIWDGLRDTNGRLDVRRGMRPACNIDQITYLNREAFGAAYRLIVALQNSRESWISTRF